MIFSNNARRDIMNMCTLLCVVIQSLSDNYEIRGSEARYFVIGVEEVLNVRNAHNDAAVYPINIIYMIINISVKIRFDI